MDVRKSESLPPGERERGKKGVEGKTLSGKLGGESINMKADSIMLHPVTGWWDYVGKV